MAIQELCRYCLIITLFVACIALPEQGLWDENLSTNNVGTVLVLTKSMYNGSTVGVRISCEASGSVVTASWLLRWTPCAEEYFGVSQIPERYEYYLAQPDKDQVGMGYHGVYYAQRTQNLVCEDGFIKLTEWEENWIAAVSETPQNDQNKVAGKVTGGAAPIPTVAGVKNQTAKAVPGSRKKREAAEATAPIKNDPKLVTSHKETAGDRLPVLATTERDGIFLFILQIKTNSTKIETFNVKVSMKSKSGYLSAIEWPFLPFFGIMCPVYVIYGIVWLVLSICNWKDLLRIQFWIGGVIFLGMLEKAVFFAEYESINQTGQSVRGAVVLAELVSCLKRTLARMLVVIVSIGFGIVKPRLGPAFHRVLGAGALYFILASIEGCLRELKPKGDNSNQTMLASIPLAVLDAAICWWVFTGLARTTRTLRLRRNLVKLSLYRHFTNTLVISVLASVAYMIWSIKQHKLVKCVTDWKELWVDEAFWHILFSVILLVIMVLWRPSINNQRYAFSPLLDVADEEAEEPMMSDAFDGVKMRGNKSDSEITKKPKDAKNKTEEDLKWIEENIPASVTDTALPSLLDSDEEVMTAKYEMSKME